MKRKKWLFIPIIIISIIIVFPILLKNYEVHEESLITHVSAKSYKKNIRGTTAINLPQLQKKLSNKQSFYLFVGRPTCPYCRKFSPTLKKFIASKQEIFYFNTDQYNGTPKRKSSLNFLKHNLKLKGVPSVYYVKNGKIFNHAFGSQTTVKKLTQLRG